MFALGFYDGLYVLEEENLFFNVGLDLFGFFALGEGLAEGFEFLDFLFGVDELFEDVDFLLIGHFFATFPGYVEGGDDNLREFEDLLPLGLDGLFEDDDSFVGLGGTVDLVFDGGDVGEKLVDFGFESGLLFLEEGNFVF